MKICNHKNVKKNFFDKFSLFLRFCGCRLNSHGSIYTADNRIENGDSCFPPFSFSGRCRIFEANSVIFRGIFLLYSKKHTTGFVVHPLGSSSDEAHNDFHATGSVFSTYRVEIRYASDPFVQKKALFGQRFGDASLGTGNAHTHTFGLDT